MFFLRKTSPHSNDDIVGPVIPFAVLLVVDEVRYGIRSSDLGSIEFSDDAKLGLKYKEVIEMAGEIDVLSHRSMHPDDHAVSLLMTKRNPGLILRNQLFRHIVQRLELLSHRQCTWNSIYTDTIYDTFIFHVSDNSCEQTEPVGEEMVDDLWPIELRFNAPVKKFEHQSSRAYILLKRKMYRWQKSLIHICNQSGFEKVVY